MTSGGVRGSRPWEPNAPRSRRGAETSAEKTRSNPRAPREQRAQSRSMASIGRSPGVSAVGTKRTAEPQRSEDKRGENKVKPESAEGAESAEGQLRLLGRVRGSRPWEPNA